MTTTEKTSITEEQMARAEYDDKMAKAVAVVKDCAYEATRTAQAAIPAYSAWEAADAAARRAHEDFSEAKQALTGVVNNPPRRIQ